MRQNCYRLSRASKTGIEFWLSLTIPEIMLWIGDINEVIREDSPVEK
ncbi:MAG: hypothetical protein FWH20_11105 [Oscillospiraceae bacterium]|nr:hypothetical protein [Oscillospiraceae bacterium]